MKNYRGIRLLHTYLYGKPTFEDKARVENWYRQADESESIAEGDELLQLKEKLYQRTWSKLKPESKVMPFYRRPFFQVAATFVAVSFTAVYLWGSKSPTSGPPSAEIHAPELKHDVAAPGTNKALLTLADGAVIVLDSAGIGSVATQGNAIVSKLDNGKIAYHCSRNVPGTIQFNTLTVPKGSKPMQLVLADGSEVWLNVASSITYPTAFPDNERKVAIKGEAYFEIRPLLSSAGQAKVPFTVSATSPVAGAKEVEIQVLGTHFNVNAYEDENSLKVTLLEGSVKVGHHGGRSIYIVPGQQAAVDQQGALSINEAIDGDEVLAWKDNWFNFNSLTVPEIMRQIEKWYNVSVTYEGKVSNKHFSGIVSRSNQVSEVLKMMEQAGIIFKIEGQHIIVM